MPEARAAARRAWAGPLLELKSVRAGYGKAEVLHDVDLTVGAGELVAVIGANGAGKSTLLKTHRRARAAALGHDELPRRQGRARRGRSASCATGSRSCPRAGCSSAR